MKSILFSLSFFLFLFYSCENQINHEKQKNKSDDEIQNNIVNETPEIVPNDNVIDFYPTDSLFTTKILIPGLFHKDEVENNAYKLKWFGLFKRENRTFFEATKITQRRVNDPILDDEFQKTGWQINCSDEDSCILLVEYSPNFMNHKVKEVQLKKKILWPDDSLVFNFNGNQYVLFAQGSKQLIDDYGQEWYAVENYRLSLKSTINGVFRSSLLVAESNFDDAMIEVVFAGDIDNDGLLDLILDVSNHYNVTLPTLYLSQPALPTKLLVPVGQFTSVGC